MDSTSVRGSPNAVTGELVPSFVSYWWRWMARRALVACLVFWLAVIFATQPKAGSPCPIYIQQQSLICQGRRELAGQMLVIAESVSPRTDAWQRTRAKSRHSTSTMLGMATEHLHLLSQLAGAQCKVHRQEGGGLLFCRTLEATLRQPVPVCASNRLNDFNACCAELGFLLRMPVPSPFSRASTGRTGSAW